MLEQSLNNIDSTRTATATVKKAQAISQNVGEQALEAANGYYQEAQVVWSDAVKSASDYTQKHPYQTILGAACVGLVAGLIFKRQK